MRYFNTIVRFYSCLYDRPRIPSRILTPVRVLIRALANVTFPKYLKRHDVSHGKIRNDFVVSFTSFPGRIDNVWMVVKSLKNQSVLPGKIILWLSKDQFPNRESIPENLRKEEDDLFEIRLVEGDLRSHKKYYYVMRTFPEKSFVTCDDDIYYHPDMLKHLLDTSSLFPGCIIANIAQTAKYCSDELAPYRDWPYVEKKYTFENTIQIGAGGVFYPSHALPKMTLRRELFMSLVPMADDIWLNAMARLNETAVIKSDMKWEPLPVKSDAPSLCSVNVDQNQNDVQIAKLRAYFIDNGLCDIYATINVSKNPSGPLRECEQWNKIKNNAGIQRNT